MTTHRYTLTISCPDYSGIIAEVTSFIAYPGADFIPADQLQSPLQDFERSG